MLQGDAAAALDQLTLAADQGLPGLAAIAADPLFAPLAADPRGWRRSRRAPAQPAPAVAPAPVSGGTALVAAGNTAWNPESERLEPRFSFADAPAAPVLPDRPKTAAYELLREHVRRGRAAGNHGDLYDNRDRGHSTLKPEAHPQLSFVATPRPPGRRTPTTGWATGCSSTIPPSAIPRPPSPAARSGAACRGTR